MISFKNFRTKINEAVDISSLSIDQLRKKFRSSIADYRKDGFFKNDKIETMFMQWGMSNGEIRTDDYAEFEDMMDRIVSEDVSEDDSIDEKKMSAAAKKAAAKWRKSPAGKAALKKYKKKYSKSNYKVDKKRSKAMKKSRKKTGISR